VPDPHPPPPPPLFNVLTNRHRFNSKSLKLETACRLSVSGVMSVVRAAMHRISGDVEESRVLPESAVITPPSATLCRNSPIKLRQRQDDLMDLCD